MAVKIRLQRTGRKKDARYRIVVADARAKRDGRFIENLGTYDPSTKPAHIEINDARTLYWLLEGAQPTSIVRNILSSQGIMFKLHLNRGINKKAITQAVANERFTTWQTQHKSKKHAFIRKPLPTPTQQEIPTPTPKQAKEQPTQGIKKATSTKQ